MLANVVYHEVEMEDLESHGFGRRLDTGAGFLCLSSQRIFRFKGWNRNTAMEALASARMAVIFLAFLFYIAVLNVVITRVYLWQEFIARLSYDSDIDSFSSQPETAKYCHLRYPQIVMSQASNGI